MQKWDSQSPLPPPFFPPFLPPSRFPLPACLTQPLCLPPCPLTVPCPCVSPPPPPLPPSPPPPCPYMCLAGVIERPEGQLPQVIPEGQLHQQQTIQQLQGRAGRRQRQTRHQHNISRVRPRVSNDCRTTTATHTAGQQQQPQPHAPPLGQQLLVSRNLLVSRSLGRCVVLISLWGWAELWNWLLLAQLQLQLVCRIVVLDVGTQLFYTQAKPEAVPTVASSKALPSPTMMHVCHVSTRYTSYLRR